MNINAYSERDMGRGHAYAYGYGHGRGHAYGVGGMGDAPCPSLQQMQGIVDPFDPCQFSSTDMVDPAAVLGGPCMPAGAVGPLAPGQVYCNTGTGYRPATTGPTSPVTPLPWGTLALVLGGVVVFGSIMGGRR